MESAIFGGVTAWLAVLSWCDLRKGEVPHSLWVAAPLALAGAYRAGQGGWPLALLAGLLALASERERIASGLRLAEAGRLLTWAPLLFLGLLWAAQANALIAFSLLGFWAAWELGWWGGADAACALTLFLIWPETRFFLAFFGCHALVALGALGVTWARRRTVTIHRLPGLPIMLCAVVGMGLVR